MPVGGARPGAGRKKGGKNRRRVLLEKLAREGGMTPVELMTALMRKHADAGNDLYALDAAAKVAPYLHPKLAQTTLTGPGGGPLSVYDVAKLKDMSDDELANFARLAEKIASAFGDQSGDSEEGGGEDPEEKS